MTTPSNQHVPPKGAAYKTLLKAWLTAGTLDALAAIFILAKGNAAGIFRYISSALFGKEASLTGTNMIVYGVLFHYLVAFSFTVFYFLIYRYVAVLRKNLLASSILYGLFIWTVMNLCVVPLTKIHRVPFRPANAIENAVILIICVALPISFFISRYYHSKGRSTS